MKRNKLSSIFKKLLNTEEFLSSFSKLPNQLGPVSECAYPLLLGALLENNASPQRIWFTHSCLKTLENLKIDCETWGITVHLLTPHIDENEQSTAEDFDSSAKRLQLIQHLTKTTVKSEVILLLPNSAEEIIPSISSVEKSSITLIKGSNLNLEQLISRFTKNHYEQVPQVFARGQWAQRGGILDIFSWGQLNPIRVELFDTEIESMRYFNVHSQTSIGKITNLDLLLNEPKANSPLKSLITKDDLLISAGETIHKDAKLHFSNGPIEYANGEISYATTCENTPLPNFIAGDFVMQENQRKLFTEQISEWNKLNYSNFLFFSNATERTKFEELLGKNYCKNNKLTELKAELNAGIHIPQAKLNLISAAQLFGKNTKRNNIKTALHHQRRAQSVHDIADIKNGELVVHLEYGIGRFKEIATDAQGNEEIHLLYKDNVTLSVPIDQSHLISHYIGMGEKAPQLSKIGDGKWAKAKLSAETAVLDYAAQLLKIQASRQTRINAPYPPDTDWMKEFESAFPYRETLGQRDAIEDVKADMESSKPMDRLICGDVGFGKTEIAIRAAFKAITGGKQVAILVPTTVLAEQHWRNFKERMSYFPIKVALLNRFKTPKEVRETLQGLASGSVDIVIGTHRLVSEDVIFKNLGVAIIDEEQRFGVKHKEKFKQRFQQIDILTLSATPIPRTLYLSLMGARDMSTIDTPPPNKVPVKTTISAYDEAILKQTLEKELSRGGQVFFLHNRVQTIELMKTNLQKLIPDAKIVIGHGQMDKKNLEDVMHKFIAGEADILLSTTIIESGIDIPNANTIIIDRADRFGLADLYQLRGRVGRGDRQAFALLLVPQQIMTGDAKRRLQAIHQYSALGSGFKIAMRDLEIRGAGNMLGTQQSGHIASVGFELYCQLLKQSIERLKGNNNVRKTEVTLRADFLNFNESCKVSSLKDTLSCFIPIDYMPEARMRIAAYKKLAEMSNNNDLKKITDEWRDRYGKLQVPAQNLILVTELKILAACANISSIEVKQQRLMLKRNNQYIQFSGNRFPRLTEYSPQMKLSECITMLKSFSEK